MKDIDTQRFEEDKQQTLGKVSQLQHPSVNRGGDGDRGLEGDLPAGIKPKRINTGNLGGLYLDRPDSPLGENITRYPRSSARWPPPLSPAVRGNNPFQKPRKHIPDDPDHGPDPQVPIQKATGVPGEANVSSSQELTSRKLVEADMTWTETAQALLYYTEQNWAKDPGRDFSRFINDCWLPPRITKTPERRYLDPKKVAECIAKADKEQGLPCLLYLMWASPRTAQKYNKRNDFYYLGPHPKAPRFTSIEEVNTSFAEREGFLRYLLTHQLDFYQQRTYPWPWSAVEPPLLHALNSFEAVPHGPDNPNPFLQLMVRVKPKESASQLEPGHQEQDAPEGDDDDVVSSGDEDNRFSTNNTTKLSQSEHKVLDNTLTVGGQPLPRASDSIHRLLLWICSPNSVGLECVTKLLPELSKKCLEGKDSDGNTVLHIIARYRFSCDESKPAREALLGVIKDLVQKHPASIGELNCSFESPYIHRVKTYQRARKQQKQTITPHELQGDPIAFYLRQQCIRNYEREQALELLYAPDDEEREQEPHFYLNLSGKRYESKKFKRTLVETFLKRLELDNILKFVRIVPFTIVTDPLPDGKPHWEVGRNLTGTGTGANNTLEKGPRPNNCQVVFQYLKESIKVKTIYEVAVKEANIENPHIPPHTDEAIIECLTISSAQTSAHQGLATGLPCWPQILTWDWQKVDISLHVLKKCAPDVETVCLYTSGSDAILEGWSSPEGLIKLQQLRIVFLIVCKAHVLETTKSIRASIQSFKTRLNKHCESQPKRSKITLDIDEHCLDEIDDLEQDDAPEAESGGDFGTASEKQDSAGILPTPVWLKKMDSFTNFIINCPRDIENPIKVAVLDDGYDMIENGSEGMESDSGIFFKATDSCPTLGPESSGIPRFCARHTMAPYSSETGHGTLMVQCIQKLCPKARLYVAKLSNVYGSGGVGPDPSSAAKAILWAVKRKVDIISMSWSIQTTPSTESKTSRGEQELKDAIEEARKANILMFAASSDEGNNGAADPVIYPASATGVFCIVAADKHGQLGSTVGAERNEKYTYAFPRELVEDGKFGGSSVATALAAGFTALILHSASVSGYATSDSLELLRKYENMNKVLEGMVHGNTRYVGVKYKIPEYVCNGDWDTEGKSHLKKLLTKILGRVVS